MSLPRKTSLAGRDHRSRTRRALLAGAGVVALLGAACGGTLEGRDRGGREQPVPTSGQTAARARSVVARGGVALGAPGGGSTAVQPAVPSVDGDPTTPPDPSPASLGLAGASGPGSAGSDETAASGEEGTASPEHRPAPAPPAPSAARAAAVTGPRSASPARPPSRPAPAEVGVGTTIVTMGGTTALSGPLAEYGRQELFGFDARIRRINDAGGIHGRRIKLVVYDGGLDPARDRSLFRRLVESDRIFAATSAGNALAVADYLCYQVPQAQGTAVPLVADVALLAEPQLDRRHHCLFATGPGVRHGASMRGRVAAALGARTMGVIMSDHPLVEGRREAAAEAEVIYDSLGIQVAGTERLELGAPSCDDQVRMMLGRNPEYLFLDLATAGDTGRCVAAMQRLGWKPRVATELAAPFDAVARSAGPFAEGFLSTSIFKPVDDAAPAMAEYRGDMARYHPDVDLAAPATLGSYLAAKVTEDLLRRAGENPTRAAFLDAASTLTGWDSGLGPVLTWSPTTRYAHKKTHLMKVTGGRFVHTGAVFESDCPEGFCAP
jgi:branched-chain amino acid transport system substrate-binding protein